MNKQTSFYYDRVAGHQIEIWKEHVDPEKPRSKTGRPLKGGIMRYTWIGYVDDTCIAHEPGWHGGTRRVAIEKCKAWAEALDRTSGQAKAVKDLLTKAGHNADWFDYFPVEHFVADKDDPSISAVQLRDDYLVERREVMLDVTGDLSLA